jgi:hypothetical protein
MRGLCAEAGLRAEAHASGAKESGSGDGSLAVWSEATKKEATKIKDLTVRQLER